MLHVGGQKESIIEPLDPSKVWEQDHASCQFLQCPLPPPLGIFDIACPRVWALVYPGHLTALGFSPDNYCCFL